MIGGLNAFQIFQLLFSVAHILLKRAYLEKTSHQNIFDRKLLREIYNNTIEQRKKKRVKVGDMKI